MTNEEIITWSKNHALICTIRQAMMQNNLSLAEAKKLVDSLPCERHTSPTTCDCLVKREQQKHLNN